MGGAGPIRRSRAPGTRYGRDLAHRSCSCTGEEVHLTRPGHDLTDLAPEDLNLVRDWPARLRDRRKCPEAWTMFSDAVARWEWTCAGTAGASVTSRGPRCGSVHERTGCQGLGRSARRGTALAPDLVDRVRSVEGLVGVSTVRHREVESSLGPVRLNVFSLIPGGYPGFRLLAGEPATAWRAFEEGGRCWSRTPSPTGAGSPRGRGSRSGPRPRSAPRRFSPGVASAVGSQSSGLLCAHGPGAVTVARRTDSHHSAWRSRPGSSPRTGHYAPRASSLPAGIA
jgi:hypothetical protein